MLLAHAAQLSVIKGARRRAALWFLSAANRLEKCGLVGVPGTSPRCSLTPFLTPETVDDPLFEEGEDHVRVAHRKGVISLLLGN